VNSALLSRCQIYQLEPLDESDLLLVIARGAASSASTSLTTSRTRCAAVRGDARNALNILELATQTAQAENVALEERHAEEASTKRPLLYDKGGDQHYDFISAFIKSMRGSDPDAAVYYLAAMVEGEDARYIARRMIVLASEDIGNADPRALLVAVAAAHAIERWPTEARLNLAQAAIYLARAPKSNASYVALKSRRPTCAKAATCVRPSRSGTRAIAERRSSDTDRTTSIRTTTRAAPRSTTCPTS
jgi:putative ATPase